MSRKLHVKAAAIEAGLDTDASAEMHEDTELSSQQQTRAELVLQGTYGAAGFKAPTQSGALQTSATTTDDRACCCSSTKPSSACSAAHRQQKLQLPSSAAGAAAAIAAAGGVTARHHLPSAMGRQKVRLLLVCKWVGKAVQLHDIATDTSEPLVPSTSTEPAVAGSMHALQSMASMEGCSAVC